MVEYCEGICAKQGYKEKIVGRCNFCGIALCPYELGRASLPGHPEWGVIVEHCRKCIKKEVIRKHFPHMN